MFSDVGKVVVCDEGELFLVLEDKVVAGDEVEAPAAELLGIMELRGKQEACREGGMEKSG